MQREASILTFANVDAVPNQVGAMPGRPAQALLHSLPDEIPATNTSVLDVARDEREWSINNASPIWDQTLACVAGAVDIAFAQHNRTNGSTVSLCDGDMVDRKLFSVSTYPSRSMTLWERPTWQEHFDFTQANVELLSKPGHALGTWFDDYNQVHVLDVVLLVADRDTALTLALRNNQIAIFDLESRREIQVLRPSEKFIDIRAGGANA